MWSVFAGVRQEKWTSLSSLSILVPSYEVMIKRINSTAEVHRAVVEVELECHGMVNLNMRVPCAPVCRFPFLAPYSPSSANLNKLQESRT